MSLGACLPSAGAFAHEVDANLNLMHRFSGIIDTPAAQIWPLLFQGMKW